MEVPVERYEFRVFGQCFDAAQQALRRLTECDAINESQEIYLLGDNNIDEHNVKIRHERLEMKQLVDTQDGLQCWRPAGQWPFPAETSLIRELLVVSENPGLAPNLPDSLSQQQLLELVTRPNVPINRANVFKHRFQFSLPACRAEHDQLLVNGAAIESLAIEAETPEPVLELRAALQLGGRANLAYPMALACILGMRQWPLEAHQG